MPETKESTSEETPEGIPEEEPKAQEPEMPPLEASARRLERLLGGVKEKAYTYSNPSKVVKRWLGTSSGATGKATMDDISMAATRLLNPEGQCGTGRSLLISAGESMETSETATEDLGYLSKASEREVESWLMSLSVRLMWKGNKFREALELSQKGVSILMDHIQSARIVTGMGASVASLFPLLARMYRYRSLVADALADPALTAALRKDMVTAHGMAGLRRDVDTQSTLLNLMLHDLLNASQVEQAQKLLSNSTFPDTASNNQLCRYLYQSGRIQALRLEYTSAFSNLSQCLRKAPTNTGIGFRVAAQRLLVVVQLLMGEIPDRHVFFADGMKAPLAPYLAIAQAVRRGDLAVFAKVVSEHAVRLQADGSYTLISRLAHAVVKAGLRKLHISYSRISLQDVADRLGLPSATSAEYVVAKAIRDGVLEATIHHSEGYVQSHDLVDVYATREPAEAFHRRIAYCLTTHNDAVRGMRYPPDEYKKQLEASRGLRGKRDNKTDEEKAQELEEEFEEDY